MAAGSWLVACLLGVVNAGAAQDLLPYNQNKLEIPIRVVPERQPEIHSLELWMSTNQGKNWDLAVRANPTDTAFPFTAPTDGIYWFNVVVIDKQQRREPADVAKAPVGLKVLVDTQAPDVRLAAPQRQGDNILVQWEIREDNPDLGSFKLEYRNTDAAGDWIPVAVAPALSGQTPIRVPHGALVRVQIKDLAGNERKSDELKVAAAGGAVVATGTPPPPPAPSSGPTLGGSPPAPSISSPPPVLPVEASPPPAAPPPTAPPAVPPPAPSGPREWSPAAPVRQITHQHTEQDPLLPAVRGAGSTVIAMSSGMASGTDLGGPAPTRASMGAMPPVQPTNQRRLALDYEVSRYGPSGVGSVDLYVTRDDGQTWQKFAGEAPQAAGTGVESKDGAALRRTLHVDLRDEGIYGFCLVVKSGAGLGKPPPRPGDAPQMRVELDSRLPDIKLYQPSLDPLQRNALVIKWEATDKNLSATPISLEWAEQPTGPWAIIGTAQMLNSGSYSWPVPGTIPARVYLRLSARDMAGNVAIAETQQPVLVDLNTPDVKIIGLGSPRGN